MTFLERELTNAKIPFVSACPLASFSTFRIGGKADVAVFPDTPEALVRAAEFCRRSEMPLFVVGNGSNLLFSDAGVRGAVLFTRGLKEIAQTPDGFYAQCGAMLPALSRTAERRGLSGLEFACGIPGTLGGAVVMNAGAHGGKMEQVVVKTEFYDLQRHKTCCLHGKEHAFGYRHSSLSDHPEHIVLGAQIRLRSDKKESIHARILQNLSYRRQSQPLDLPSAGSAFKRPPNGFAAELIDRCGLKGICVGGAMVSPKHAGFVVNTGNATAADVWKLLETIRQTVLQKTGILLEPEIRVVGKI